MKNMCPHLMEWMVNNPEEAIRTQKEIDDKMRKGRCVFAGETLKLSLTPFLLKPREYNLIARVSELLSSIVNKILKVSLHDKEIESYFSYKDIPKSWTDVDKGYELHGVITRLDAIFDGENLKFLEFNTDNPGGKGWTDIFEEIMFSHSTYKEIFSSQVYEKKSSRRSLFFYNEMF